MHQHEQPWAGRQAHHESRQLNGILSNIILFTGSTDLYYPPIGFSLLSSSVDWTSSAGHALLTEKPLLYNNNRSLWCSQIGARDACSFRKRAKKKWAFIILLANLPMIWLSSLHAQKSGGRCTPATCILPVEEWLSECMLFLIPQSVIQHCCTDDCTTTITTSTHGWINL